MPTRLDYWDVSPDVLRFIQDINTYLKASNLDTLLRHLVLLRISQINGCGYCIDLHGREALRDGESQERLDVLAIWHDTTVFKDTERAALAWAETLTNVAEHGASDKAYDAVQEQFSERDLVDLTFLISTMNAWNRMGVGFAHEP